MANNVTREKNLAALANAIKSYADSKVATITGGGASYILPTASTTQKGGIMIGTGLSMAGDTLNVTLSGEQSYFEATTLTSGLMSAADKAKLNSIANNANNYTLPTASTSTKGGIIVGDGLSMAGDTLNVVISGGSAGGSDTELVLSNTASTVNGAMWLDSVVASTAGDAITLSTLMPATVVNGSMWLEV